MEEENKITRIEEYLSGQLSTEENIDFEKEMTSDPELGRLFREHKYFLDGIAGMKANAFAEKMRRENPVSGNKTNRQNNNLNIYISVAAGILILLGISYLIMQPTGPPGIAKEFYTAPLAEVKRSTSSSEDSLFRAGMEAFGRKQWKNSITAFNQIPESHPSHDRVIFYMAHAFAGAGVYEKALALFSNPAFNQGQYLQQAQWYRILMKMYLNRPIEDYLYEIEHIASEPHLFYSNDAKEILKKMKK